MSINCHSLASFSAGSGPTAKLQYSDTIRAVEPLEAILSTGDFGKRKCWCATSVGLSSGL